MKVYIHFESEPAFTLSYTPQPNETVSEILSAFASAYNNKNPSHTLSSTSIFLSRDKNSEYSKRLDPSSVGLQIFQNKEDFFVHKSSELIQKKCTHNGCGKHYIEGDGSQCYYHPGAAVFHEGLKGWGCCSKRVITFEEFLELPGCTIGDHTDVAVAKPQIQAKAPVAAPSMVTKNDNVETYGAPSVAAAPIPEKKKVETEHDILQLKASEDDPEGQEIQIGANCKRYGCQGQYTGPESRQEKCEFHVGPPLFHEGSKGWNCCPKRTVWDFNEIYTIPGCRTGKHKFLPFNSDKMNENETKCRHDWYQQGNFIIFCVYGKNIDKEKSTIQFEEFKVKVHLNFKDGKFFKRDFDLPRSIEPEKSKFEILSTKVEMKLFKKDTVAWANGDF